MLIDHLRSQECLCVFSVISRELLWRRHAQHKHRRQFRSVPAILLAWLRGNSARILWRTQKSFWSDSYLPSLLFILKRKRWRIKTNCCQIFRWMNPEQHSILSMQWKIRTHCSVQVSKTTNSPATMHVTGTQLCVPPHMHAHIRCNKTRTGPAAAVTTKASARRGCQYWLPAAPAAYNCKLAMCGHRGLAAAAAGE